MSNIPDWARRVLVESVWEEGERVPEWSMNELLHIALDSPEYRQSKDGPVRQELEREMIDLCVNGGYGVQFKRGEDGLIELYKLL